MNGALARLASELRSDGGLVARATEDPGTQASAAHGASAASGPRAAADPDGYALLVEAIREGYLLHHGEARVVRTDDGDLALLAGDRLFALGLARLAAMGDLDAVAELADVIALAAAARAAGNTELAEAIWDAGAAAVGHGPLPGHAEAKAAAAANDPGAAAAFARCARDGA